MKYLLLIISSLFTANIYSQEKYVDEDANGNWIWREVIEFNAAELPKETIVENLAQWLDRKKALFNTAAIEELEGYKIDQNILEKSNEHLKGYLHGSISRTGAHAYVVRLYVDVEVREGRFRVTFSDMTVLANVALGLISPPDSPTILTKREVIETFKKKKGPNSLDETIERLVNEIKKDSQRANILEETEDDW